MAGNWDYSYLETSSDDGEVEMFDELSVDLEEDHIEVCGKGPHAVVYAEEAYKGQGKIYIFANMKGPPRVRDSTGTPIDKPGTLHQCPHAKIRVQFFRNDPPTLAGKPLCHTRARAILIEEMVKPAVTIIDSDTRRKYRVAKYIPGQITYR